MGRPETDFNRRSAISIVAHGLDGAERQLERIVILEAQVATEKRLGNSEMNVNGTQSNLSNAYVKVNRYEEALALKRQVYAGLVRMKADEESILAEALNLSVALMLTRNTAEAIKLLSEKIPDAKRTLGDDHNVTLSMRWKYATALCSPGDLNYDINDINEGIKVLENVVRHSQRVLGPGNPNVRDMKGSLAEARRRASVLQGS